MKFGSKLSWLIVTAGIILGFTGVTVAGTASRSASSTTPSPTAQVAGESIVTSPLPSIETSIAPAPSINPSPTPSPSLKPSPIIKPSPSPKAVIQPSPTSTPTPIPVQPKVEQNVSEAYTCDCGKTCPNMSSCAEAQYQLNVCGCSARDADNDGIACDSAPMHCQN